MIRSMTIGLAALMLSHSSAYAEDATPPGGLVVFVLGRLNAFYDDVEDPTNRPVSFATVPDGVLQPVEINRDGKTDWLIAWPEAFAFCGTGGCQRTLYVSAGEGFIRALDRQALTLTIGDVDGEVRVEAWVHHLNCADERPECRFAWAWDDRAHWLVQRPATDGITLLAGTGPRVIDESYDTRSQDSWPRTLTDIWESSRLVCPVSYSDGYEVHRADIAIVPDMNDDGRPDWVVTQAQACDFSYGPSAFQVWTTTGEGEDGGDLALAYTASAGTGLRVSLAVPKPGLLISLEVCEAMECDWVPLRWNAGSKSLTD